MYDFNIKSFQGLILCLQNYWLKQGCIIVQPIDIEVGAGTSHPITFLGTLGPEPISAAYVQSTRRPKDSRYGKNSNRLQHYYQFQVIIKPIPKDIQNIYLNSLKLLNINFNINDIRFVEDNWENPTLGAWGLGWEVWLNGIEITQFTYFQQTGGISCNPVTVEITYGLERLAMHIQNLNNVYNLIWSNNMSHDISVTYGDIFFQNEKQQSIYNYKYANIEFLLSYFSYCEKEAKYLLKLDDPLPYPAYERVLKAAHIFNLLDSRKALSITEKKFYIFKIRKLANLVANTYYLSRKKLNFPLCKK